MLLWLSLVTTALSALALASSSQIQPWMNTSLSARKRAEALAAVMTWDEKIGQLGGIRRLLGANVTFDQNSFNQASKYQNGNIGFGETFNQPVDVLPIVNRVRAQQINSTRLGIPFITITDSVNGILLVNGTLFPASLAMASTWNMPLYGDAISVIREEQLSLGVNWVLSPELDLALDPRNGRVGEMYGEDPYLVGEFGSKYVQTMQAKDEQGYTKVATTIKHWIYGQSSGGVNMASIEGGVNHIFNQLASPYDKVIKEASPMALMTSYAAFDGVPMSTNKWLVRTVLREHLGFKGHIMSDAVAIPWLYTLHRVATSLLDAAKQALLAGLQMELSPSPPAVFTTLLQSANDSSIQNYVTEAATSMLEIKFATGLFEKPLPTVQNMQAVLRAPAHLETNRKISREAIVLLQNDGILPLQHGNKTKVALLGPLAGLINAGSYSACLSNDSRFGNSLHASLVSELGSSNVQFLPSVDIVNTTNAYGIAVAVAAAKAADLAILMLGSLSIMLGDPLAVKRTDGEFFSHAELGFPGLQQQLLDAVLDAGVPTILILSGGQAFALDESSRRANAIMHSFNGGEYTGDSLVEILMGKVNPSGKLPVTLPAASGTWPIAYDYLFSDDFTGAAAFSTIAANDWLLPTANRHNPIYPFGFGLSYTSFTTTAPLSSLVVYTNNSGSDPGFQISTLLTNTGPLAGQEVVQLYYRQQYTRIIETPNLKLVRFQKISLLPGQSQNVSFMVPFNELGYYNNMEYQVDSGNYTFWLGTSSSMADLRAVNVTMPER